MNKHASAANDTPSDQLAESPGEETPQALDTQQKLEARRKIGRYIAYAAPAMLALYSGRAAASVG